MDRMLISETPTHVGEKVTISGWVHVRRDHGKVIFIDLRDRSGKMQTVVVPKKGDAYEIAKELRAEYIVSIDGLVKKRPGGSKNEKTAVSEVEIEIENIKIVSKPEVELPIDVSNESLNLQLDTLLNFRSLDIRNEKIKAIFDIYGEVLKAYEENMRSEGFHEIKTPKIVSAATEGGANVFKIKYFEKEAFLAQSPQFYKQTCVGAFERVFEIGPVFRAEPHYTTRHVNEYISLDAEMGFIENFGDIMDALEKAVMHIMESIDKNCQQQLAKYEAVVPEKKPIPRIKLTDALEILKKEYGKNTEDEDIDPEGERLICDWVKKTYDSDFVFLTHYPVAIRPFYAMPSAAPDNAYTESFDLLFRGLEIVTGGQRIHDYKQLVESIEKRGLKPEAFEHYLDIFRWGMPPHGGWGLGSERIVQQLLGLKSIKEAVLFPRDVKRLTP